MFESLTSILVSAFPNLSDESDNGKVLIDFWEFVRFDIVLNQPNAEAEFGFRLADRNNSGFIDAEELMSLLNEYKDIDEVTKLIHLLSREEEKFAQN